MSGFPATVGACVEEAIARSAHLVEHAIDQGCVALQDELHRSTSTAVRQELTLVAAELAQFRSAWSAAFPGALRKSIESANAPRARTLVSPSTLTLTLVDDDEVTESIESSRLAQQLAGLVEKPLAELDRYVSSALALDAIHPEHNPLRPAVFAQALRAVMNDPAPEPGRPALWMRHMAAPIAADLGALYERCCQLLARAQVRPADYRVMTGTAPLVSRSSASTSASAPLAGRPEVPSGAVPLATSAEPRGRSTMSQWIELATQRIGGPALREFLFGGAPQAQVPLAPAYYQQIDDELAALEARGDEAPADPQIARQYQHLPAVDRPVRAVGTETALSGEAWGALAAPRQRSLVRARLRKQAQRMGQVMGLDLVRQLVDEVAQDPRLLAPVREAMVALEPPLARLALHSPRFFTEQDNPARRLLEAVAQRSFRFNDEFSTDFREFFDGVRKRFSALNDIEDLPDATPFRDALTGLAADWSQRDHEEELRQARVVEAVQVAERRQSEADQIAWELSHRSDLAGAPAVVQEFVFGPWALVIAHARLEHRGPDIDPGGYIRVIADLLWSVKPDLTLRDPARAFDVIPRMLPTLRAGLDMLGHAPAEAQTFFRALERLHRPVLKLRARHRQQSLAADSDATPLDDDLLPAPAQKPQARDAMWLRAAELRDFGFEDTLPSDYAPVEPRDGPAATGAVQAPNGPAMTGAATPLTPAQVDAVIAALQEGCWVDLFSKHSWLRARLQWASTKRTLFMFVSQGGRPHSMTRRSMQQLVGGRLLRPVDSHEVVQHALDALVRPRTEALAA